MGVALVSRIRGESFFGDEEKRASGGASGESEKVPKIRKNYISKDVSQFQRFITESSAKKSKQILKPKYVFLFLC
jgi:hypothetical protein